MKNANPVLRGPAGATSPSAGSRHRPSLAARRVAVVAVAVVSLGVGLAACAKEKAAKMLTKAATTGVKTAGDFFPIKVGDQVVRMQLAVREGEMQRGLMQRRDLARDEGMIFVYAKPQQMSFWMRNTPTPLDIGFFNREGVLEEVYPLHPFDETSVTSRSQALQFAVEVNQGWFLENKVKPGAKLDLKALAAALEERGFDPRKFGL